MFEYLDVGGKTADNRVEVHALQDTGTEARYIQPGKRPTSPSGGARAMLINDLRVMRMQCSAVQRAIGGWDYSHPRSLNC
jgi:hypothetical protein